MWPSLERCPPFRCGPHQTSQMWLSLALEVSSFQMLKVRTCMYLRICIIIHVHVQILYKGRYCKKHIHVHVRTCMQSEQNGFQVHSLHLATRSVTAEISYRVIFEGCMIFYYFVNFEIFGKLIENHTHIPSVVTLQVQSSKKFSFHELHKVYMYTPRK